jgi:hypothetical protein
MMPSVVIAGGTSVGLGASLTRGILSLAPDWDPIILSRKSSSIPAWLSPLVANGSVKVRHVEYQDHASLVKALYGAHTVISVLLAADETWYSTQIALLNAAKDARAKRFAPSEFGVGDRATPHIDALKGNQRVWKACEDSGLEWTRYENGIFMNYLGFATKEDVRAEALAGREVESEWCYYVTKQRAEIPVKEDGSFPQISMTSVEDVGKFVAKSLDLEKWEPTSSMVGQTLRMDEVVHIAEKVLGCRWEVVRVPVADMEKKAAEEKDSIKKMWLDIGLMFSRDLEGEGFLKPRLNRLCPDVKPLTVEGYLRKYYR